MITLAMGAALCTCSPPPSKASADDLAIMRQVWPGVTPACLERVRVGGIEAIPPDIDDCVTMALPRKWTGTWSEGFEWSQFCPGPARPCGPETTAGRIWLTFSDEAEKALPPSRDFDWELRFYRVEFIGQRTAFEGQYGHGGVSNHEIVVDRLLSITPIHPTDVR